jgi:MFS family permease
MRRSQTLNYCLCFFITGLPLGALGPSLPIVVESFGVDIETVGITFSVFFSGYLFGALISAVLIQRIAGHRLLALGLFVLMLTFLAAPWAANLWALWLIWGLLGVSVGSLQATLNTLLIWVHKDKVAPHMNAAHFSFGLGALLTPLLIIQSINFTGSINGVYWFSGIIAGVMMLRLLYLTSPKIPTVSRHITTTSRKNYPSMIFRT